MSRIILASKSPRRFELLSMTGLSFEVRDAHVDEDAVFASVMQAFASSDVRTDMYPVAEKVACAQASAKASAALSDIADDDAVVIGSDTVVVTENEILGKPKDEDDARRMLTLLSGKTHRVYTGVSIQRKKENRSFSAFADVKFHKLDEDQKNLIESYIASGSPMDKAGASGIQDTGSLLIDSISGDYYAVVGLPVARVYRELLDFIR